MNLPPKPPRILWAVDPSKKAARFYKTVPQVLRYFLRLSGVTVEPVHVLSMAPEVSAAFTAQWRPQYSASALRGVSRLARELKLRNLAPTQILFHETLSTRGAVDTLTNYAERSGADLIVAQTHSRKGIKRLFVGSFAETLLFRSKVPVMLINQRMRPFQGFRHILFPTDFGRHSRMHLNRVIALALAFRSRITLFHSIQHPIEPTGVWLYPSGSLGPFPEYVQDQIRFATQRARAWVKTASAQGVTMDYVIDEKGLSIWNQILHVSRKQDIDLIAMEAQSGPFSSTLLGSVTRQVVRQSLCPVWVLKPKMALAKRQPLQEPPIEAEKAAA
jgi:nucleotide-binding universal stress UspA family protein